VVSLIDVDFRSPPENVPLGIGTLYQQPEFTDVIQKLKKTKSYEKLATMIEQFLPSLFKTRVDDIIYTTLHRAILPKIDPGYPPSYSAPYFLNKDNFWRAFQELMYQFQQPEIRCRYIAPIFDFDAKKTARVDKQIIIRKATPYDRHLISEYKYADVFVPFEYDCVLEIELDDFDIKQIADKKLAYTNFIDLSILAMSIVSCLRIFSGSHTHLRFGVFIFQEVGLTYTFPGLIESPELALKRRPDVYIMPKNDAKELPTFWHKYQTLHNQDYFNRAINRYTKAIKDHEDIGKFIDFVLSLDSLFKDSLAEVQYRAASLVSHRNKYRRLVYDFLDIVYSQRGSVMHGEKSFGKKFEKKLNNFYGQKRDFGWFLSDLHALVRQCLRLSVIACIPEIDWKSTILDIYLKHKTNRSLVGISKGWVLRNLPSFF
jgi:hypothetical protein